MKEIIILSIIFTSTCGLLIGTFETFDRRLYGKSGCEYRSYISYFPAHWIGCELFRDRTIK